MTNDDNVKVVHTLVMSNKKRDLRSIHVASEVGISLVTGMLTNDQKRTWLDSSRYLLFRYEDDPGDVIERVVIQDETWVNPFEQSQTCRTNNGSTLAHPLLRHFRGFMQQGK